jgi:hypothetical protein
MIRTRRAALAKGGIRFSEEIMLKPEAFSGPPVVSPMKY